MFDRLDELFYLLVAGIAITSGSGVAQSSVSVLQLADRGPIFYMSSETAAGVTRANSHTMAVLQRQIAIDLDDVPLDAALLAISRASKLRIVFNSADVPHTRTTLQATKITLAGALNAVLTGADLDVSVSPEHVLRLLPRGKTSRASEDVESQDSTVIRGTVTDASSKAPLPGAVVRVLGTDRSAITGPDGLFSIAGLPVGTYRLTTRRLGYAPAEANVAVDKEGSTYVHNFALTVIPAVLDRVVTTVTGDRREVEVGSAIATISVDSITPTAPVTSLTDVISARAPSVEVVETGGLTGSGEAIRIRGQSSLALQPDPIVIVDGVRQDNSAGGSYGPLFQNAVPSTTRLNDIDFSDVEKIEVVKGPSASAEYGTDAANGVVIIRTKKGAAGSPRWNVTAETGLSDIPVAFPNYYYGWGHANGSPVQCAFVPTTASPYGLAVGNCNVDSVTSFNPLNHSQTSVYGQGGRQKADLSVSGGSESIRYYVTGGLSQETGIVRMPDVFRTEASALGLPHSTSNPNGENQRSIRANTTIALSPVADLSVSGAYLSTFQTLPFSTYLTTSIVQGPVDDSAHSYGYGLVGGSPLVTFAQLGSQQNTRLTGGLTANWRIWSWLSAQGVVGIDHGSIQQSETYLPQAVVAQGGPPNYGSASAMNGGTDVYSASARLSGSVSILNGVQALTSTGLQYVDTRTQGLANYAFGLPAANLTLNGAPNPAVLQTSLRQATLGGYVEEHLSFLDRLFVTGALRVDGASGFGSEYSVAAYPKTDLSVLLLNTATASVRLRGAFGESGVQPYPGASKQLYQPKVEFQNGASVGTLELTAPGNPNLGPERSSEFEAGIDIGLWNNKLTFEATTYQKITSNALFDVSGGWTLGNFTYEENIGEVHNLGVEGLLNATLVDSRVVRFDVTLNGSINSNKLVKLAPGISTAYPGNFGTNIRQAVGYPLYGFWAPRVSYKDAGSNSVLGPDAVTVADSASFLGSSIPTREASLATRAAFAGGALAIGALADYRAGFLVWNGTAYSAAQSGTLPEENVRGGSLSRQANDIAANAPALANIGEVPAGFFQPGDFIRLREVSLTYAIGTRLSRALHLSSTSLTLAVRNLALWTRYGGPDPEISNVHGSNLQSHISSLVPSVNNDVRMDAAATPLARYWLLRLNIGF